MTETDFISDLIETVDDVLQIRDEIGVLRSKVYLITRTWTGSEPGDGTATESKSQVLPTPWVIEIGQDHRLIENGVVKSGDVIVKQISKKNYPYKTEFRSITESLNVERFWDIKDELYTVIHIKDQYATWQVHLRKLSKQTRYPSA